jgi:hypothetical protein
MIPSRVLKFGEILGETFVSSYRITKKTIVWIAAVTILSSLIQQLSFEDILGGYHARLKEKYPTDSASVASYRNGVLQELEDQSIFPILFPEQLSKKIDMPKSAIDTTYPHIEGAMSFIADNADILTSHLPLFLVLVVLYFFLYCFLTDIAIRNFEERTLRTKEALLVSIRKNTWLVIMQYLIIAASMVVGLSFMIALSLILPSAITGLLLIAGTFAVIAMLIRVSIAPNALISEEIGLWKAIVRSIDLVKGNVWRVIGYMIGVGISVEIVRSILDSILSSVITAPAPMLSGFINGEHTDIAAAVNDLKLYFRSSAIVSAISSVFLAAIYPVLMTTIYYSLRTKIDGPLRYDTPLPEVNGA